MNVILTRYLYFLDECFYSLLMAFLNKNRHDEKPFEEVAFWVGEIFYSGFEKELWEYIWKFYYDFYAIKYPKYEKKINMLSKKVNCSENKKLEDLMYVINLLYYSTISYDVFISRMLDIDDAIALSIPKYIYKKTNVAYIKNMNISMNKNEIFFIRSIHDKRWQTIIYYITKIGEERCYYLIKKYFEKTHKYTLKESNLININYKDKKHIIIALIHYMWADENNIQKKRILKRPNIKIIKNQIDFNENSVSPLYNTLNHKRLFGISPLIGIFDLSRYKENMDYKDILRLHWEYFAYKSSLWRERIDAFGGKPVKKSHKLNFKSDEDFDGFYEQYNYEPDEQPKDVQNMSICEIDKELGISWLNNSLDNSKYYWMSNKKLKTTY